MGGRRPELGDQDRDEHREHAVGKLSDPFRAGLSRSHRLLLIRADCLIHYVGPAQKGYRGLRIDEIRPATTPWQAVKVA